MTDITPDEATALVSVLSLAENHQMWTDPARQSEALRDWADEQYAHIGRVRRFLKRNGILTLSELTSQMARAQLRVVEGGADQRGEAHEQTGPEDVQGEDGDRQGD